MSLRYEACVGLAAALETAVPALVGKVHAQQGDPSHQATWPCLTILPRMFHFDPWQENELAVDTGGLDNHLLECGDLSGTVELQITAASAAEREDLEELVINAMFQRELAPGTLIVTCPNVVVAGVTTGYDAPITFSLVDAQWQEEFVFDQKRMSFLVLNVELPILVLRTAYDIENLTIALTADLESDTPVTVDEVVADEDGLISPYTP